jgi:hypothetical protein
MSKVIVSERVTLDGVSDADTMDQWFQPYFSDEPGEIIKAEACLNQNAQFGGDCALLSAVGVTLTNFAPLTREAT